MKQKLQNKNNQLKKTYGQKSKTFQWKEQKLFSIIIIYVLINQ